MEPPTSIPDAWGAGVRPNGSPQLVIDRSGHTGGRSPAVAPLPSLTPSSPVRQSSDKDLLEALAGFEHLLGATIEDRRYTSWSKNIVSTLIIVGLGFGVAFSVAVSDVKGWLRAALVVIHVVPLVSVAIMGGLAVCKKTARLWRLWGIVVPIACVLLIAGQCLFTLKCKWESFAVRETPQCRALADGDPPYVALMVGILAPYVVGFQLRIPARGVVVVSFLGSLIMLGFFLPWMAIRNGVFLVLILFITSALVSSHAYHSDKKEVLLWELLHERSERMKRLLEVETDLEAARQQAMEERDRLIVAGTEKMASRRIIGFVAHEFLNPIHRLLFCFESMWDTLKSSGMELTHSVREDAEEMRSSLAYMRKLVDDLFLFDQAKGSSMDQTPEPLNVEQFLEALCPKNEDEAQSPVDIEVSVRKLPETIMVPPVRLFQALNIALDNSLRLTTSGSIRVTAQQIPIHIVAHLRDRCARVTSVLTPSTTVSAQGASRAPVPVVSDAVAGFQDPPPVKTSAKYVLFEVIDTGPGIGSTNPQDLFLEFKETAAAQYSGVGLSIALRLATSLGGYVGLENNEPSPGDPGIGCRFFLVVPYAVDPATTGVATPASKLASPMPRQPRGMDRASQRAVSRLSTRHSDTELTPRSGSPHRPRSASASSKVGDQGRERGQERERGRGRGRGRGRRGSGGSVGSVGEDDIIGDDGGMEELKATPTSAGLPLSPSLDVELLSASRASLPGAAEGRATDLARSSLAPALLSPAPTTGTVRALTGLKVLYVDDEAINRRIGGKFLRQLGCEVDTASDGDEVLPAAESKDYDMFLLDLVMARMSGLEACRALRAAGFNQPVVAVTANANEGNREAMLDAGFTRLCPKPFDKADLERCLLVVLHSQALHVSPNGGTAGAAGAGGASGPGRHAGGGHGGSHGGGHGGGHGGHGGHGGGGRGRGRVGSGLDDGVGLLSPNSTPSDGTPSGSAADQFTSGRFTSTQIAIRKADLLSRATRYHRSNRGAVETLGSESDNASVNSARVRSPLNRIACLRSNSRLSGSFEGLGADRVSPPYRDPSLSSTVPRTSSMPSMTTAGARTQSTVLMIDDADKPPPLSAKPTGSPPV